MSILITILLVVFVIVAVLMIFVVLMQRPKSEGLGAAFGGGVTENLFGAQTTNVLTKITGWLAAIFFILTFVLSILYAKLSAPESGLRQELMKGENAATAPAVPAPADPAVGPPGTVTNPTPAAADGPAVAPADPPTPADQAVGVTGPQPQPNAPPTEAEAPPPAASPAATAQPTP